MQGWRKRMEDTSFVYQNLELDLLLLGIFDGHGGDQVSKFCKENFKDELLKNHNFI